MSVIDVVALHRDQALEGPLARLMAQAAFAWELGSWRERQRAAAQAGDWRALMELDREYERIGLP